jgi:dGTPase
VSGGVDGKHTADTRTDGEHDTDRILYSDAFRRLAGVTQVVAADEKPLFHNRLTHTLKVAQLSRRTAEHLNRTAVDDSDEATDRRTILEKIGGVDAGSAEAAGLAHDLGHPPFGHIAEAVLNDKCAEAGLDGFEGNAQTLRILTKLTSRGKSNPVGLGLSDRTLRAVIKYPWLKKDNPELNKWGAYPSEADIFKRVRKKIAHKEPSVEAMIMDWADDISYAVHDLEDFFRAGQIPLALLIDSETERLDFAGKASNDLERHNTRDFKPDLLAAAIGDLKALFPTLRHYRGTAADQRRVQDFSKLLIDRYVSNVRLRNQKRPLMIDEDVRHEVLMLKQLTWQYVINDPALATLQEGQKILIARLFDKLVQWIEVAEKNKELHRLPQRLREWYDLTSREDGCDDAYGDGDDATTLRRARATADYLAFLTEDQAIDLYERVEGLAPHSVLESWLRY